MVFGRRKRKRENVYLGKRVPDIGKPGLDALKEVRGIAKSIYRDYESGVIDKTLALKRLALLKLVVMRDHDFQDPDKRTKALRTINYYMRKIKKG